MASRTATGSGRIPSPSVRTSASASPGRAVTSPASASQVRPAGPGACSTTRLSPSTASWLVTTVPRSSATNPLPRA